MEERSCRSPHCYRHRRAELPLNPGRRLSLENTVLQRWTHPLDLPRQSPPNNKSNSISQAVALTPHKPQTHAHQPLRTDPFLLFLFHSMFQIEITFAKCSRINPCYYFFKGCKENLK